eukprot:5503268-Lingulodinium_polyedra.AAC.1
MVALIDNSDIFRHKFGELTALDDAHEGGVVRNMGRAQHRMESMKKPLGRSVLKFSAQLNTGRYIMSIRRGKHEASI